MRNQLDPERVVQTIAHLSKRIEERFPDASLMLACRDLLQLSREATARAFWIGRPIIGLRVAVALILAAAAIGLAGTISQLHVSTGPLDLVMFVNFMDSSINNLVLLAAAAYFLVSLETRVKRRRALLAIHELRSLAHSIDMHQLTKDPDRLLRDAENTKSSPVSGMTLYEMSRYLEYCGEMFSLIGKIASIYGLYWHDSIAIDAVNDVETLTTGLSQKMFQKLRILHGMVGATRAPAPAQGSECLHQVT